MAEESEPETETASTPKKGGLAGMLPMIGGVIGGLALGAILGLVVLGPRLSASPAPVASASKSGEHDAKKGDDTKKSDAAAPIYQMDNLVLNPAGSGGTRFLLLSVALQVKDAATLEIIKGHDAELRDMILRLFGNKTVEQVSEASARDALRAELKASVDGMFPAGTVQKVYFPQFVIQ